MLVMRFPGQGIRRSTSEPQPWTLAQISKIVIHRNFPPQGAKSRRDQIREWRRGLYLTFLENDDVTHHLSLLDRRNCLVDLFQPIPLADQLVELEPTLLVELHELRNIDPHPG